MAGVLAAPRRQRWLPAASDRREKEIISFSQAQGANFHCQPTGRQLAHTQMLDGLAGRLPAGRG